MCWNVCLLWLIWFNLHAFYFFAQCNLYNFIYFFYTFPVCVEFSLRLATFLFISSLFFFLFVHLIVFWTSCVFLHILLFFAHLVVFCTSYCLLHILLSFAHLIVFCTSYCFLHILLFCTFYFHCTFYSYFSFSYHMYALVLCHFI